MSWLIATWRSGAERQISRRMCGRPRKNVESAASSIVSPAFQATNRYGPLPTGARPNGAVLHASRGSERSRCAGRMRMRHAAS